MSNETTYYISTGDKNCYYTLRCEFDEPWGRDEVRHRDYHICNLSIDQEEAQRKAKERTGLDLVVDFDLNEIRRRKAGSVDWSIFQAGKYEGRSIHEVLVADEGKGKEYLIFLAENCAGNQRYAKTIELYRALITNELTERQEERDAEAESRKQAGIKFEWLANRIEDGRGGFCDSIAADIRSGRLPKGRAYDIVIDICGKQAGRSGSKAYNAETIRVACRINGVPEEEIEARIAEDEARETQIRSLNRAISKAQKSGDGAKKTELLAELRKVQPW